MDEATVEGLTEALQELIKQDMILSQSITNGMEGTHDTRDDRHALHSANAQSSRQLVIRDRSNNEDLVSYLRGQLDSALKEIAAKSNDVECMRAERDAFKQASDSYRTQYESLRGSTRRTYETWRAEFEQIKQRAQQVETDRETILQTLFNDHTEKDALRTSLHEARNDAFRHAQSVQRLEAQNAVLNGTIAQLEARLVEETRNARNAQAAIDKAKFTEIKLASEIVAQSSEVVQLRSDLAQANIPGTNNKKTSVCYSTVETQTDNTPISVSHSVSAMVCNQTVNPGDEVIFQNSITRTVSTQTEVENPASGSLLLRTLDSQLITQLCQCNGIRPRQEGTPSIQSATPELSQMSVARRAVLDALPAVTAPPLASTAATFSRAQLSVSLGGSTQGVDGAFAHPKPMAVTHDLTGCLYPQRGLNPWLPQKPGEHGYLFLGLHGPFKDHERFLEPTKRALFICEEMSKWRYYGVYMVHRHPERDLSLEEWTMLPDVFKDGANGYCATTLSKRMGKTGYEGLKNRKSDHETQVQSVRADYDAGKLRVPCILLTCVEYQEQLVADLSAAHASSTPSTNRSGKRKRKADTPAEDSGASVRHKSSPDVPDT